MAEHIETTKRRIRLCRFAHSVKVDLTERNVNSPWLHGGLRYFSRIDFGEAPWEVSRHKLGAAPRGAS